MVIPKGCYTYTCPSLLNDSHCPCSLAPSPATHVFRVLACCGPLLQPEVILSPYFLASGVHVCMETAIHHIHTLKFLLWKQMNFCYTYTGQLTFSGIYIYIKSERFTHIHTCNPHTHTHIYLLILVEHGKGFSE